MGRPRLTAEEKEQKKDAQKEARRQKAQKRRADETADESHDRRRSDRLRSQNRRANQTAHDMQVENEAKARRMASLRSQMTEEERQADTAAAAARMASLRSEMTEEERRAYNAGVSDKMASLRSQMTEEERQADTAAAAARMASLRSQMTEEERRAYNAGVADKMASLRSQMTEEERQADTAAAAARMASLRSQMSDDEIELMNLEAAANKTTRRRPKSMLCFGSAPVDDDELQHHCGQMAFICIHCGAKHFEAEKNTGKGLSFGLCCKHGEVKLQAVRQYPEELRKLFDLKHFRENIRLYNNVHAFASFNAQPVKFANNRGPYSFVVQGQIYYNVNQSGTSDGSAPLSYGQIYITDPDTASGIRGNIFDGLDKDVLKVIGCELSRINVHAKSYNMLYEEHMKQKNEATPKELFLLFGLKPGVDKRRYNLQASNEVAAIFSTNANGEIPDAYVTVCDKTTKKLATLSSLDPHVEPWIYPLLHPYGHLGWNIDMKLDNPSRKYSRLTRNAYLKFKLRITGEFNPLLSAGRLLQQWIVDNYLKVEKERVDFLSKNQKTIHAEKYSSVIEYLRTTATLDNLQLGKVVILPSTFIGSPRYMEQSYEDAMTIVSNVGKPDLFITMTTNPNWPEIVDNLLPNQQASDRPDIVARVFHLKVEHLLKLITKQHFFGEVAGFVYTVEFQKRGLPHVHLLVTLKSKYKIRNADVIDSFISAELPDAEKQPKLREIVTRNMLHGPCSARCIVKGKCSKKFPMAFLEKTTVEDDGFPKYRRRNNGDSVIRNRQIFDNSHVVPYCPQLTMIMNCHLNVEVAGTVKCAKYIFKYICKGHDRANFKIDANNTLNYDECESFSDSRYIGAPEAAWRIFNFGIHDRSHTVIRLSLHLEGEQPVVMVEDMDEEALNKALDKRSMLSDYFELNMRDKDARQLFYHEIPTKYVWKEIAGTKPKEFKWTPRKQCFNTIGRVYTVSPSQSELFYLRILLRHRKGAKSFVDLRTVNGKSAETNFQACVELGLIADDGEWEKVMREAVESAMPYQLRRLFVSLLINCEVAHPEKLWTDFKEDMAQDFARTDEATAEAKAYREISILLQKQGKSLSSFPTMDQLVIPDDDDQTAYNYAESEALANLKYGLLNAEQKSFVDVVAAAMEDPKLGNCFYMDGPGGSGKTFVYTTLYHKFNGMKKKVSTMAFTGIASILLPGGRTCHKTLGLPVPLLHDSSSSIRRQSKEAALLRETDMFIWDEAPMAPKYALEVMDRLLRSLMNKDVPFGGKLVILGGDFRQLLPVMERGTRSECVSLSIKMSHLWKLFKVHKLTQNMRADVEEIEFSEMLMSIGNGTSVDENDTVTFDNEYFIPDDLPVHIYAKYFKDKDFEKAANSAILSCRNVDVAEINDAVIDMLDSSTEKTYTSTDETEDVNDPDLKADLTQDYLNSLNPPSLPPHTLRLRLNTVVMLLRNVDMEQGLCNGTRLLVTRMTNHLIAGKILTGDRAGNVAFIHRFCLVDDKTYGFPLRRRQFPIKPAFAMTINKSQGQTFETVGIDLRNDVFSHGQLYVALSRAKRAAGVKLFTGAQRKDKTKVKNIVYQEIIQ